MKNCILLLAICVAGIMVSCKKESIITYNSSTDDRFIYFSKSEADTSTVSFYLYPGQTTIDYPVVVKSTGYSTRQERFAVSVIEEYTTASKEDYSLPEEFLFRPERESDTFYVKLYYSEKLDKSQERLVIELRETSDFKLGMTDSRVAVIWFHNNIVKPEWWKGDVESSCLGKYSEAKYRLFLQVVQVNLDDADFSTFRHYALVFKRYLEDRKAAGDPALEDDGTEMTVAV